MATVRAAAVSDVPALSAALAQAFANDPVLNWLLPHRSRRRARRELMFTLELQTYVLPQEGLVFTADDPDSGGLAGGCVVLPPARWRMPQTTDGRTAMRWLRTFGTKLPRATRTQRTLEQHHPAEPHYYIRSLGVTPTLQGEGLGTALMRPALDRCDSEGVSAYLEASSDRSAALYERLGFVHLGVLRLPDGAPPLWPMRRPPRG
ncbi:MAG TPA: GNAT family N-acetyltransferase [Gaiellaceae bacterium]|nr:GNAT family N-acetyltransferase [Gaiellaceae bacterium]